MRWRFVVVRVTRGAWIGPWLQLKTTVSYCCPGWCCRLQLVNSFLSRSASWQRPLERVIRFGYSLAPRSACSDLRNCCTLEHPCCPAHSLCSPQTRCARASQGDAATMGAPTQVSAAASVSVSAWIPGGDNTSRQAARKSMSAGYGPCKLTRLPLYITVLRLAGMAQWSDIGFDPLVNYWRTRDSKPNRRLQMSRYQSVPGLMARVETQCHVET